MRRISLLLCLLLLAAPAWAEDLYVSQSGAGSANASSCANAWSVATLNTAGNWGSGAGKVSAGDTVRFCGTITSSVNIQGSGSAGSLITFTAEAGSTFSKTHWTTTAIGSTSARSYLTLTGLTIEATASGTGQNEGTASAISFESCSNCTFSYNTLRDTYVRTAGSGDDNTGWYQLYLGGGSDIAIHHNTLRNERYLIGYGCPDTCSNISIYSNTLSKSAGPIIVSAYQAAASLSTVSIYDNDISDMSPWGGWWTGCGEFSDCWFHCDGMHIVAVQGSPSAITGLNIYRNYLHGETCMTTNPFTQVTNTNMTAWIYVEGRYEETGGGQITNPKVYNNVVNGRPGTNGHLFFRSTTGPKIYQNTLIGYAQGTGGGIDAETNSNVVIKNNLIGKFSAGVYGANSNTWSAIDYNAYFNLHATNSFAINGCCNTWAQWNAAGYDTHGWLTTTTALGLDTSDWDLNTGSILIDAGANLSTDCPTCTPDRAGVTRPLGSGWDVGAYEWVTIATPSSFGVTGTSSPQLSWNHDGVGITYFAVQVDSDPEINIGLPTPSGQTYAYPIASLALDDGQHTITVRGCNGLNCGSTASFVVVKLEE